jgi:predicted patatin/cPLA2 family phospholipase
LFGAEFAYHTIADELDPFDNEAFEINPMEFHLVATEVHTGRAVYRKISQGGTNLYEWLRASSAMPVLSKIVDVDGYQLLDGGIADSIPLRYFQGLGYERNLVVLTQPSLYRKTPLKMQWLIEKRLSKYPALCKALAHRHEMYNRQLLYVAEQESKGNVIVIQPESTLPISHITHDRAKMRETYNLGRKAAEKKLPEIMSMVF